MLASYSIVRLAAWRWCVLLLVLCLSMTLSKAVRAEAFYIENYDIRMTVNADATLDFVETIDVVFTEERHGLIRRIPYRYPVMPVPNGTQRAQRSYTSGDYNETFIKRVAVEGWQYQTEKIGDYLSIRIGSEGTKVSGKQRYVISYRVINAINFFDDHSEVYYNLIGNQWDVPIQRATFSVQMPRPIPLAVGQSPNYFAYTGSYGSTSTDVSSRWQKNQILSGTTTRSLQASEGLTVGVWLPQNYLQATDITPEMVADHFYIQKQDIQIALQPTGASKVTETYTVRAIDATTICRTIKPYIHHQGMSSGNLLGGTRTYLVNDLSVSGSPLAKANGSYAVCIDIPASETGKDHTFTMQYLMYGNLYGSNGDHQSYAFSLPRSGGEPVAQSQLSIQLPPNADASGMQFDAYVKQNDGSQQPAVFATNKDGVIRANSGGKPLFEDATLDFDLKTPQSGFFTQSDFGLNWRLWWLNNGLLFLPLVVLGGLYRIWQRWGKDEEFAKMVHYYPPADLNPAEAGILIDDKLHDRDLLALIPYWGTKGYITLKAHESNGIMGIGKSIDYEFTLQKPLPIDAPAYEQTMFRGIFGSVNSVGASVRLSSLKNRFYTYMQNARQQLEAQIVQRSFYVPNTRGSATLMMVLGGILAGLGGMLGMVTGFGEINSALVSSDLAAGLGISGILTTIIGYFMPKKAPVGMEAYKKLYGFKMFVEDAEKNRLEAFLREDPHYFDKTLPYAIVFDLTEQWANKFKDLTVPPPEWYSGNRPFVVHHFVNDMDNSMRTMGNTFTSTPPSTSGGSGFGGGGGFSGGGFGGGGGSSW